ncbi:hypothetical protein P5V15_008306 [Pogonomyrmex californicus]
MQASLNDLLHDNIKGKQLIVWTSQAFEKTRKSLASAALLAYPKGNAKLALFTDTSDRSVGAATTKRQQRLGTAGVLFEESGRVEI